MFDHYPRILWQNRLAAMTATLETESTATVDDLGAVVNNRITEVTTFSGPVNGVISLSFVGSSRAFDTVALSALNIGTLNNFEVRYKTLETDTTWQTFDAPGVIDTSRSYMKVLPDPVDAEVINFLIEGFFNVAFTGGNTATIGNVSAGTSLLMERPFYSGHTPSQLNASTEYWFNSPDVAHNLGRVIKSDLKLDQIDVRNITPNWYESNFQPFVEHAKFQPFYYDWSPNQPGTNAGFCMVDGDIKPSRQGQRDLMEVKADLVRLF